MGGYQADTFQCASLMHIQQIMVRFAVAQPSRAIPFFISCIKCLWDFVGHFLGRRSPTLQTLKPMALQRSTGAQGVEPTEIPQMPT